jgi:hypothetical protein
MDIVVVSLCRRDKVVQLKDELGCNLGILQIEILGDVLNLETKNCISGCEPVKWLNTIPRWTLPQAGAEGTEKP